MVGNAFLKIVEKRCLHAAGQHVFVFQFAELEARNHPANIMSKKEFIIVQTFNDGRPMTLDGFTRERGATWTFGYFGAKTYTLAGAERIATQVINKHDLKRSMLPDSKGVSFMKMGSEKFNQLFSPAASTATDAAKLAEEALKHAAQVAEDNNQPERAKYFTDLANRVYWEAPNC